MATATLTTKGQITLPKVVRERLGLHAGDRVAFDLDEHLGRAVLHPMNKRARDVFGLLAKRAPARPVSTDAMREAVGAALKRRSKT